MTEGRVVIRLLDISQSRGSLTSTPCPPEEHYLGLVGHLLPSGVASILCAVSALWRADELLDTKRVLHANETGLRAVRTLG